MALNGKVIVPGESKYYNLRVAKLPTHTVIDLPVYVSRSVNDGPVLLLTAGLHGNETNGIEIVRRLISDSMVSPQRGTVIAVPIVNIYGFLQQERYLPDGKDLNRSFPGSKTGSLASRVAHVIVNQILPLADYGIDFHTGGASKDNYPQIRCVLSHAMNLELAKAFGAPFIINSALIDKSFRKAAQRRGKSIIVYEGGESLRFDEPSIQCGIDGTLRLMKSLNMIDDAPDIPVKPRIFEKHSWIRAKVSGLFRTTLLPGDKVTRGQTVGSVTDPYGETNVVLKSPVNGYIVGLSRSPVVSAGDAVVHLGHKYELKKTSTNET
ncbi:MAG: succinylglutamate desuccinylase/aspartoacylase family protein [Balneolales bacterium]|nr:succinylglutamate desuccinylase/aspartoacylase family protein [Balneolales bacterium]